MTTIKAVKTIFLKGCTLWLKPMDLYANGVISIYCRVPAGRGLRKTTMAASHDETQSINPLVHTQVD